MTFMTALNDTAAFIAAKLISLETVEIFQKKRRRALQNTDRNSFPLIETRDLKLLKLIIFNKIQKN